MHAIVMALVAVAIIGCGSDGPPAPSVLPPPYQAGPFADLLGGYLPGRDGDPVMEAEKALGPADGMTMRIGDQGALTLIVTQTILNGDGPDFEIVLLPGWHGEIVVYVSDLPDDRNLVYAAMLTPETPTLIDLAGAAALPRATYIRLASSSPDARLDAIRVLHSPQPI